MSDYIYDSTVVDTSAGQYRIDILPDMDPLPPEYYGCGIAYAGTWYHDQYQNATGDDAGDILRLIRYHSASNQDIWDRERRSPAALARYVRLKYGYPVVLDVYRCGDRYAVSSEPSADRFEPCEGLAWAPTDASNPTEYARGMVAEYSAWATGEVYGYRITDPSGDTLGSCFGYYPDDSETSDAGEFWSWGLNYMYQIAVDEIEADVVDRAHLAATNPYAASYVIQ